MRFQSLSTAMFAAIALSASALPSQAHEIPLRVAPNWADNYALFFLKAVLGPGKDYVVFDPVKLRHMVEWNFYFEHKKEEAKKRFQKWWKQFERRKLNLRCDMATERTGEDFVVTFEKVRPITFWLTLHSEDDKDVLQEPRIEEWKLKISPGGQCTLLEIRTLFTTE